MPKLFTSSDIHSAYTPWMEALNEAGFDENNPEHIIVVCGDLFDRMDESLQVYDFVKNMLEKGKLIYIKGNHESLMEDCLSRGFAHGYDISNGTEKSIIDLAPDAQNFYEACTIVYEKMKPLLSKTVDYFETKNYIFVHSFVPLKNLDGKPMHYTRNRKFAIDPDWRHAHASAWEEARWGNPFELAKEGFLPDKTLVFGHWSTYDQRPYDYYDGEDLFDPIYGNGYIGIDATTALSGQVNVLVLEDEFMEE
jgi:serine/threonine protein phosphatase 1